VNRRILIPTDDSEGTILASHFGRAQYLLVVEFDGNKQVVGRQNHPNTGSHMGGQGYTHDNVLSLKPDAVIVAGMGPRGLSTFQSQNIPVLRADSQRVDQIVSSYLSDRLEELTEGCREAHHRD
jgi:predicted Fe-Mo cluster-binding NifX family protein